MTPLGTRRIETQPMRAPFAASYFLPNSRIIATKPSI